MKKLSNKSKIGIFILIIASFLVVGCYEFEFVHQPKSVDINSTFEVPISILTNDGDSTNYYVGYFSVQLPVGWNVSDSIHYTDLLQSGYFIFSDSITSIATNDSPPKDGYRWFVFQTSDSILYYPDTRFQFKPVFTTSNISGMFFLDYYLGDNENGLISLEGACSLNNVITVGLPDTVVVTNSNNSGPGSLRHAIDSVAWGGLININLERNQFIQLNNSLEIYKDVYISGNPENLTKISGNDTCCVIKVNGEITLSLLNLIITNGKSETGGGLCLEDYSSLIGQNLIIQNNWAEKKGGGISCGRYSRIDLVDVTFDNNYAGIDGGAIYASNIDQPYFFIDNALFQNNKAEQNGGGISLLSSSGIINNTSFIGNESFNKGGGGLYINQGNIEINNSTFEGNNSRTNGGALLCRMADVSVNKSIIDNNKSDRGGGVYCYSSTMDFLNSLIVRNRAGVIGGGLYCRESSDIFMTNSTFIHNTADMNGGGLACVNEVKTYITNGIHYLNEPNEVYLSRTNALPEITVTYTDLSGGKEGILQAGNGNVIWLDGNIDEDPQLVFSGDHIYQINDNSPCINAGTTDTTGLNLPEFDLAGEFRLSGSRIDMGAYEWNMFVGIEDSGIENTEQTEVSVYPNPANHKLYIKTDKKPDVEIFTLTGERMFSEQKLDGGNGIDISHLPGGIYFIKLQVDGKVQTKKMVKM